MMATPMASATSSLLAPARAAPRACEAMQPSHCEVTAMPRAMSSLVFDVEGPRREGRLWVVRVPLVHVGDERAQGGGMGAKLVQDLLAVCHASTVVAARDRARR